MSIRKFLKKIDFICLNEKKPPMFFSYQIMLKDHLKKIVSIKSKINKCRIFKNKVSKMQECMSIFYTRQK